MKPFDCLSSSGFDANARPQLRRPPCRIFATPSAPFASPIVTAVAIVSLAAGSRREYRHLLDPRQPDLNALPVKDPREPALLRIGGTRMSLTNPQWEQIKRHERLLEGAFVRSPIRFDLAKGGQGEMVDGLWASSRYFDVPGVSPCLDEPSPRPTTFGAARTDRLP